MYVCMGNGNVHLQTCRHMHVCTYVGICVQHCGRVASGVCVSASVYLISTNNITITPAHKTLSYGAQDNSVFILGCSVLDTIWIKKID